MLDAAALADLNVLALIDETEKDKTTSKKKKKHGLNNFNNAISQSHDRLLDLEQQLLKTNNESKNDDTHAAE